MEDNRYQFFKLDKRHYKLAAWEHKFFFDRKTQTVFLPCVDFKIQLISLLDNELVELNGKPYCRLQLYAEFFPEMRDGLLRLEQRVKEAA